MRRLIFIMIYCLVVNNSICVAQIETIQKKIDSIQSFFNSNWEAEIRVAAKGEEVIEKYWVRHTLGKDGEFYEISGSSGYTFKGTSKDRLKSYFLDVELGSGSEELHDLKKILHYVLIADSISTKNTELINNLLTYQKRIDRIGLATTVTSQFIMNNGLSSILSKINYRLTTDSSFVQEIELNFNAPYVEVETRLSTDALSFSDSLLQELSGTSNYSLVLLMNVIDSIKLAPAIRIQSRISSFNNIGVYVLQLGNKDFSRELKEIGISQIRPNETSFTKIAIKNLPTLVLLNEQKEIILIYDGVGAHEPALISYMVEHYFMKK